MSNENSSPQSPPSPSARRASFTSQRLSGLFSKPSGNAATGTSAYPGSIATAAANVQAQQRRRLSISSLGLSGSPTQPSPFGNTRNRRESHSSGAPSLDENAVEDDDAAPSTSPTSPFVRRMSFGARALRDINAGVGTSNGRPSVISASPPSVKGRGLCSKLANLPEFLVTVTNIITIAGEGYNWSDQLRSRAQRSTSVTSPPNSAPPASATEHQRSNTVAAPEQSPKTAPPARKVPDAFQERILKGDFYID